MRFDSSHMDERAQDGFRLAWASGTALLPQHFQHVDRRMEYLHRALAADLWGGYAWGIHLLEIDDALVAQGEVRVRRVAGRFQDGTPFDVSETSTEGGTLSFRIDFGREEDQIAVCIPRSPAETVTGKNSRFIRTVGKGVPDVLEPTSIEVLDILGSRVGVKSWTATGSSYHEIPIARVRIGKDQVAELTPDLPACFEVPMASVLGQRIRRRVLGLRAHLVLVQDSHSLQANWSQRWDQVVGQLPQYEVWAQSRLGHPYDVYLRLAQLYGDVCALSGQMPQVLVRYDHATPSTCIDAVLDLLDEELGRISVQPVERANYLPFEADHGRWTCVVPNATGASLHVHVCLGVQASDAACSDLLNRALICWSDEEPRHRALRIKGMSRRVQRAPDAGEEVIYLISLPSPGVSRGLAKLLIDLSAADGSERPASVRLVIGGNW